MTTELVIVNLPSPVPGMWIVDRQWRIHETAGRPVPSPSSGDTRRNFVQKMHKTFKSIQNRKQH